ncbi:hypothetical protein CAP48_16005 [Advenella sp. S44]|uniref:helix-turn-helix transcriptional regulator n=1 Tax=Advenella sp. S44 TaxID=1982755 RepID=UPI000C2A9671|nr:AraC family transcriptional regulator [Advenella sp. S44]PJX22403.1 hypothetical protein CAP48_16005 [Advenella sp. S44]
MTRAFTYADFVQYGEQYGVTHYLPEAIVQDATRHQETLAYGQVREHVLCQGVTILHTDMHFLVPYHAQSRVQNAYSFAMLLNGQLRIGRERSPLQTVGPACGINTSYRNERMQTHYLPGMRLAALDVVVDETQIVQNAYTERLLPILGAAPATFAVAEQDDAFLDSVRLQLQIAQDDSVGSLVYEALGLQLLARVRATPGAPAEWQSNDRLSREDHDRLGALREYIRREPWQLHTIGSMSQFTGMGESALRKKFQLKFNTSIMACVKEYRLQMAQRFLEQGESVEKVALLAGYRHSSNFSTAFKRRFGVNPRRWSF